MTVSAATASTAPVSPAAVLSSAFAAASTWVQACTAGNQRHDSDVANSSHVQWCVHQLPRLQSHLAKPLTQGGCLGLCGLHELRVAVCRASYEQGASLHAWCQVHVGRQAVLQQQRHLQRVSKRNSGAQSQSLHAFVEQHLSHNLPRAAWV